MALPSGTPDSKSSHSPPTMAQISADFSPRSSAQPITSTSTRLTGTRLPMINGSTDPCTSAAIRSTPAPIQPDLLMVMPSFGLTLAPSRQGGGWG